MKKIIVLGAGLVGKAIAADLSKTFEATVSDLNVKALSQLKSECKVKVLPCDFKNGKALAKILLPLAVAFAKRFDFLGNPHRLSDLSCFHCSGLRKKSNKIG